MKRTILLLAWLLLGWTGAHAQTDILSPTNATWKYLDNGSDQGTAWRGAGFNDASWPSGAGPLGYGMASITTTQANGRITYYHRRMITVGDPNIYSNLVVRLRRDDAAVVYINDVEVFRANMPAGPVDRLTLASSSISGGIQFTYFASNVPPSRLIAGANLLAVEVHQASSNNVDSAFDLELAGQRLPCTPPTITTQPVSQTVCSPGTATFTVGASGTAPLTYQWRLGGANIGGANGSSYATGTAGSYSVVVANSCGSVTSVVATLTVLQCGPVITDISPATAQMGDIITITGSGFDPNPRNNCVVVKNGARNIPLRVVDGSSNQLRVLVNAVPPGTIAGKICVATGKGAEAGFVDAQVGGSRVRIPWLGQVDEPLPPGALRSLALRPEAPRSFMLKTNGVDGAFEIATGQRTLGWAPLLPIWTFCTTNMPGMSTQMVTLIPTPPPPSRTNWVFSTPATNGGVSFTLSNDCAALTEVLIQGDLAVTGTDKLGIDIIIPRLILNARLPAAACAQAICDLLVAAYAQAGITINCVVTALPGNAARITITVPGGSIDGAGVLLCFTPAEANTPLPFITGVSPLAVTTGDLITIEGGGFGNNPDDICGRIMGTTSLVGLRVLTAQDDLIVAEVGEIGPNAQPGPVGIALGIGGPRSITDQTNRIVSPIPAWVFASTQPGVMSPQVVTVIPTPPPPPAKPVFYAAPVNANGEICITVMPDCPAGTTISIEAHFDLMDTDPNNPPVCPLTHLDSWLINSHWQSSVFPGGGGQGGCAQFVCQFLTDIFYNSYNPLFGPCFGYPVSCTVDVNTGKITITADPGCGCKIVAPSFVAVKYCIPPTPVLAPVIFDVQPAMFTSGQIITIRGTNFPTDPDDICLVVMNTNRFIPMRALTATPNLITAEVGPIPPDATSGRIGLATGHGSVGSFRPAFADLLAQPAWFFSTTNAGVLSPANVTPVYVPPPPMETWYHSFLSNGQIYVYLPGPCPPGSKLIMDGHFDIRATNSPIRHCDTWLPAVNFLQGGSALDCAWRVCDSFVCGFFQRTGVLLDCRYFPAGNGGALICIRYPGGTIVNGCMTVCVRICDTPPVATCVSNIVTTFTSGTLDNFAGAEASSPRPELLTFLNNAGITQLRGFDDNGQVNRAFAHSFANLPDCITKATLRIRLRANSDIEENDGIALLFAGAGGVADPNKWSSHIGAGNAAPGVLNTVWSSPSVATLVLDLGRLPLGGNQFKDLIPTLCAKKYLDLYVQDDTSVDFAELTIESCRCRADIVVWAQPGQPCTVVTYARPTFTDLCCPNQPNSLYISCVPPSGACFPIGMTAVHCSATDAAGRRARCCFKVNVIRDTTPPVVQCPPPTLTVTNCIIPGFTVTATDDCATPAQLTITQTPPANTPVLPGTYYVTIKVCDPSGNCSYCYVTVYALGHAAQTRALALFNTGVNALGNLLTAAAVDPHFALTVSADGTAPPPNAEVTSPVGGAWMPNAASLISQWISPRPDTFNVGEPNGNYTYQTTFNLTGLDPNSAQITGRWAADDTGTLFLNGLPVISAPNRLAWTSFSINSGFIAGVNTLELRSQNLGGGPTGVRLEMTGTADDFCVTNRCVPPPWGLGMWLALDELTGSTVYNSVLGAPNGEHYEGAFPNAGYPFRHVPGQVAYGVRFDGRVDNIQVPDYFNIAVGSGHFSLDGWVRLDVASTTRKIIMEKRGTILNREIGFSFAVLNNRLVLRLADANSAQDYVDTGATLAQGQWYFVAVTVQRGSANGIKFYVNGLPTGSVTPGQPGSLNVPNPLIVGHSRWQNFPANTGWRGLLDELELFRYPLSAPQILALWSAQDAGKCKLRCKLAFWDYHFPVNSPTFTENLMICNDSGTAQTYNWFAQGLPAGVCVYNTYAGPTQFAPPSGTVTVPALGCVTIPITVTRPAGITAGQSTCFQVVVRNTVTAESCHAESLLFVDDTLNVAPTNSGGMVVLATTNVGTATFLLQNLAATPRTLNLRFVLYDGMMLSNPPTVSLNGLPPGTPLPPFSVTLASGSGFAPASDPPGSVTNLIVGVQFVTTDPGPPYSLVLESDLAGDGIYTGITSVTLLNTAGGATSTNVPPTLSLTIRRDANGRVIVEWPVGPELQETTFIPALPSDWTDVEGAMSPYTATNPPPVRFFRLKLGPDFP